MRSDGLAVFTSTNRKQRRRVKSLWFINVDDADECKNNLRQI